MTVAGDSRDGDRVVVGVDGSIDSVIALIAGALAADLLDATLVVVTTWIRRPGFRGRPSDPPDRQRETEALQSAVIRAAFGDAAPARIERVVRSGPAGVVLVRESERARLAVVGRRGHGGFSGLLLGSVSMSVVVHARCSVLVLGRTARLAATDDIDMPGVRRVVVGVDGEAPSVQALAMAGRAAIALEARLDVVTAWGTDGGPGDTTGEVRDAVKAAARARQLAAIEQAVPAAGRNRVTPLLKQGSPSAVLVAEGGDADLLVVGIRSRSALAEGLAGSAALTAAAEADCPVLVVREGPVLGA